MLFFFFSFRKIFISVSSLFLSFFFFFFRKILVSLTCFFLKLFFVFLKDRDEKIKREIEELFLKLIMVSKNDMEKFEEQEMKKIRPIKRNWFDRLIKQNVTGKKPKIIRDKLKMKE